MPWASRIGTRNSRISRQRHALRALQALTALEFVALEIRCPLDLVSAIASESLRILRLGTYHPTVIATTQPPVHGISEAYCARIIATYFTLSRKVIWSQDTRARSEGAMAAERQIELFQPFKHARSPSIRWYSQIPGLYGSEAELEITRSTERRHAQ